jgi:hypothetical protein
MPARSINRCETICASDGVSFNSGRKYRDRRMGFENLQVRRGLHKEAVKQGQMMTRARRPARAPIRRVADAARRLPPQGGKAKRKNADPLLSGLPPLRGKVDASHLRGGRMGGPSQFHSFGHPSFFQHFRAFFSTGSGSTSPVTSPDLSTGCGFRRPAGLIGMKFQQCRIARQRIAFASDCFRVQKEQNWNRLGRNQS